MKKQTTSLHAYFEQIPDFRLERNKMHSLSDIIILSVLAVLSGAESWNAIELYGREKLEFIRTILSLPNGIPSHDTINRVFSMIKPELIESAFISWVQSIKNPDISSEVIAIDGKCIRGSKDTFHNNKSIYMVSAWASKNGLSLGQIKVDEKSNEITAIPELLDLLDIKDMTVSIDAIGTQHDIASRIIKKKADYILAAKGNQKALNREIIDSFVRERANSTYEQTEKGHGRIETRRCEVLHILKWIDDPDKWCELKSLIKITATRISGEKSSTEIRYYISSLQQDAKAFNDNIRAHWGIENSLHWVLDMVFDEDWQRKRNKHAAHNFSFIRKIALNLLKLDKSKDSMVSKRLKAGWSNEYLMKLIQN